MRKTLNRLVSYGKYKRYIVYYYKPKFSEFLSEYVAPYPHNVALAIARKSNLTIVPEGNTALNLLGLSTQVPAHWTYLSDGLYRKFTIRNIVIDFKHRNNKEISGMSSITALVIQALKTLGKAYINQRVVNILKDRLSNEDKENLINKGGKQNLDLFYNQEIL